MWPNRADGGEIVGTWATHSLPRDRSGRWRWTTSRMICPRNSLPIGPRAKIRLSSSILSVLPSGFVAVVSARCLQREEILRGTWVEGGERANRAFSCRRR